MPPGLLRAIVIMSILSAFAPAHALKDLCGENDTPIFSCTTTNHKLVSVCASEDISETKGYFVYRFGTVDGRIELQLPSVPEDFRRTTTAVELADDRKGEDDWIIRFRKTSISYIVYGGIGNGWHIHGVAVFRDTKLIQKFPCIGLPESGGLTINDQANWGIPFENDAYAKHIWNVLRPVVERPSQ